MSLSSVLPGLREVRAALVAGWLYLLLIWLWFADDVRALDDEGIFARIVEAATAAGTVAAVVVASIAAFLVGSLVNEALRVLIGRRFERRAGPGRTGEARQHLTTLIIEQRHAAARRLRQVGGGLDDYTVAAPPTTTAVAAERHSVRQSLVGKHPELLAEIDRQGAEAELRAALLLPLALLIVTIAWQRDEWGWSLLLIPVIGLGIQAIHQVERYGAALAEAVRRGHASSITVDAFEASVDAAVDSLAAQAEETDPAAQIALLVDDWQRALALGRVNEDTIDEHFGKEVRTVFERQPGRLQDVPPEVLEFLFGKTVFDSERFDPTESLTEEGAERVQAVNDALDRLHGVRPSSPPSA